MGSTLSVRRLLHWTAVAGVAVAANVGAEIAAHRFPNSGFSRLIAFAHKGGPQG